MGIIIKAMWKILLHGKHLTVTITALTIAITIAAIKHFTGTIFCLEIWINFKDLHNWIC